MSSRSGSHHHHRSSKYNRSPRKSPHKSPNLSPRHKSPKISPTRDPDDPSDKPSDHGSFLHSSPTESTNSGSGSTLGVNESESFSVDSPNSGPNTDDGSGELISAGPTHVLDIPIRVTKLIFTFVPLDDLLACMLTCSAWYNVLGDENIKVWKINCLQRLSKEIVNADYLKLCTTYKSKLRALIHAWNSHDCSENATIIDHFTFVRNQVPQTSDGCRAKIGFREGRHVWQLVWMDPLGSAAVVGCATRSTLMSKNGYIPLLGHDRHSWGWNLVSNVLIHKGDSHSYYPLDPKIRYKPGEILHVLLDCEEKTLSFKKNGHFLGVAFKDLPVPKKELFPSISSVYGGTRISMVYLGTIPSESRFINLK